MTTAKPTTEDIVALEKSYWDAMKAKDGKTSARLSGKTTLVTGPQGAMKIEKDKMGAMTESGDWTLKSYEMSDIEVSVPTPDVAIIVYKVTQTVNRGGKDQKMQAADCSTWVRGKDGWECHAHSESLLDGTKAA